MTHEQEALVEAMLELFVRGGPARGSLKLEEAGLVTLRRLTQDEERVALEGGGPPYVFTNVGLFDVKPSESGALVLALAAERDLWRLRCEWQEARAARSEFELEDPETTSVISEMSIKEDAARAAYVAAGGTP